MGQSGTTVSASPDIYAVTGRPPGTARWTLSRSTPSRPCSIPSAGDLSLWPGWRIAACFVIYGGKEKKIADKELLDRIAAAAEDAETTFG